MKKKVLALFLAVVMMITALPFNAFALSYGTQAEVEAANRYVGLNFCGFSTTASHITTGINYNDDKETVKSLYSTNEDKLEEIEAVLSQNNNNGTGTTGYVNQSFLPLDENLEETLELYINYDVDFWISLGRFFSSSETLEHYVQDAEYWVNRIRAVDGAYEHFLGFWWDEPLWNGMSNDDMYAITKALYEKWGKRNYIVEVPAVFSPENKGETGHVLQVYEIKDEQGNVTDYQKREDPEVEWLTDKTLTYITDIGFDNYSWDVRTTEDILTTQASKMASDKELGKGHDNYNALLTVDYDSATGQYKTARGFYLYIIDTLCKRIENRVDENSNNIAKDTYIWFYPAAYTTSTHSGGKADEAYCNAHFNFFKDQLVGNDETGVLGVEEKYTYVKAGGITLYSYESYAGEDGDKGTADDNVGLSAKLPIKVTYDKVVVGEDGKPTITPVEDEQLPTPTAYNDGTNGTWSTFAQTIQSAKVEFSAKKLTALEGAPFGSLDVADVDHQSITINAVAGYEYTINAGTYDATTGKFTGLEPETTYTITVTRTADKETATFDVTTTASLPYASGLDDTASYILKMPSNSSFEHMHTDYGWPSIELSRNATDDGWYTNSSDERTGGGYIPIVTDDGERFLEFKLDTENYPNDDGNTSVNLSLGDATKSSNDVGFDDTICPDVNTSNLKYFAYRFKVNGGGEGQVSKFDIYMYMTTDTGTYQMRTERANDFDLMYLDKNTLTLSKMTFEHGITLTEQAYDGWLIIPFDAYTDIDGRSDTSNLDNIVEYMKSYQLFMCHHEDAEKYCKHVGGTATSWANRTLKIGDVMVLEDVNTFVERKQSANVTAENEKNILTVPVDSPITFNPSDYLISYRASGKNVYGYFWGLTRYNEPNFMYQSRSKTIGGEQFFSYEVKEDVDKVKGIYNYKEKLNADGTKNVADRWYTLFLPANYTLGVNFSATADNIASYPSASRGGEKGGTLYGEQTIATLYSDAEDYKYVAFRLKTEGGKDGETSPLGVHIGTSDKPIDLTGTAVINYNDGTTTTVASGTTINVPSDFDGWIVVPSDKIATATRTGFVFLKDDNYSWYGKTLYHGNIKIVKDLDTFKKAHGIPEFTVNATNTSIQIDTESTDALFTINVDDSNWLNGINWKTAAEFNTLLASGLTTGSNYTIYAKNPGAVKAAIAKKSVWTIEDTAKNILTVPDRNPDGAITSGGGWIKGGTTAGTYWSYWGLYNQANNAHFTWMESVKIGDENFFAADMTKKFGENGEYTDEDLSFAAKGAAKYSIAFIPASYTLKVSGTQNNPSIFKTVADLYPGVDFTGYDGVIVRLKVTGGDPSVTSRLRFNIGNSYAGYNGSEDDFLNTQLIDKTTGKVTTVTTSSTYLSVPYNFDGWFYAPASALSSASIAELKTVTFAMQVESATSNWDNKTIYFGDMNIVEDVESFVQVHLAPDFEVTPGVTSLTVLSTATAKDNVRYSLDKTNWLTAEEFNNAYSAGGALEYDTKYVVYAKYESAPTDNVVAKTVWTAPYSTHKNDGGHYFLNVYDDVDDYYLEYVYRASTTPIKYPAAYALTKKSTDNGTYDDGGNSGGLFIRQIDGETFIEFDKNEVWPDGYTDGSGNDLSGVDRGCVNQTINQNVITYGGIADDEGGDKTPGDAGLHSSIDTTNLTHAAIRIKIDELDDANKRSNFWLYLGGKNTQDLTDAYIISKDGTVTDPGWTDGTYTFNGEFDGWIVLPFSAYDTSSGTVDGKQLWTEQATNFNIRMHKDNCDSNGESNWDNKILYLGDITVLEGDAKFKMVHTKPDFELDADNTSITVTDAYEDGDVLYTVDQKTWLTRSEFNSATNRKSFVEYTVSAVFANAADKSFITSKTIWTLSDTAESILTVPDRNPDGAITSGGGWINGGTTAGTYWSYWGLYNQANNAHFTWMESVKIGDENFFAADMTKKFGENGEYTDEDLSFAAKGAAKYGIAFIPASYTLKVSGAQNNPSIFKSVADLYPGVDFTGYDGVIVRLKVTGGDPSVTSRLRFNIGKSYAGYNGSESDFLNTQLIDKTTGKTTTITESSTYLTVPYNFDGWLYVPASALSSASIAELKTVTFAMQVESATSNWDNKTIYFGDMNIIKDLESFKRVHFSPEFEVEAKVDKLSITNTVDTKESTLYSVDGKTWLNIDEFNNVTRDLFTEYTVYAKYPNAQAKNVVSKNLWLLDDSKNILKVPAERGFISRANSSNFGKGKDWGIATFATTTTAPYGDQYSVTENGENFFEVIIPQSDFYATLGKSVQRHITYLPATYSLDTVWPSVDGNNADYENAIGELYSDAASYSNIAIRLKVTGGDSSITSTIALYCGAGAQAQSAPATLTNVQFVDLNGTITTIEGGTSTAVPYNFDGWIIIPSSAFASDIASIKRVGLSLKINSATDNWDNRTLRVGDMKIIKNANDFISTICPPDFDVALDESNTKLVVTNDADTAKRALYSIDGGVNWRNIDYINAVTLEDDYIYEVKAKYPWSDEIVTSDKLNTTLPYSTGLEDGASYFMNVYDDYDAHPHIAFNTSLSTVGIRETAEVVEALFKDDNGEYTSATATGKLNLAKINGETFIEFDRNENINLKSCTSVGIYHNVITYQGTTSTAGIHSSIDRTNLSHLAIRIKIDELEEGASNTSGFYLYIGGKPATALKSSGTYIVDLDGKITEYTASESSLFFTGEFDGWVIIPFSAYNDDKNAVDGKELITNTATAIRPYIHGEECHYHTEDGWDNKILYFGDMLVLEDDDLFVKTRFCDNDKHNLKDVDAITATDPNENSTVAHKHCTVCGKNFDAEGEELNTIVSEYGDVVFQNASLTLDNSTAVNFKADADALSTYTNVRAEFVLDGETYTIAVPDDDRADFISGDTLVFTFDDVPAEMMGETIKATLYATSDDNKSYTSSIEYSVKEYCYNKLEKYADDVSAKAVAFKTLIVDLLYYGSAVQLYTKTNTDNLVKDDLTRDEKALASVEIPEMNGLRAIYNNLTEGETTKWKSGNVSFQHNVQLKFNFTIDDTDENISNYKLVFSSDPNAIATGYEIEYSEFAVGKSDYAVYFDEFDATQMDSNIYVTVFCGDTQVSDTLVYSISSYARQKYTPNDPTNALSNVVLAMMKYGNAAKAYDEKGFNDYVVVPA